MGHVQRKFGLYAITTGVRAAIVGIGDLCCIWVNGQDVAFRIKTAALRILDLGCIEVARQLAQSIAVVSHYDVITVRVGMKSVVTRLVDGVAADNIKRGQPVLTAVQIHQVRVVSQDQYTQMSATAVQLLQRRIGADIQCTQMSNLAAQRLQRRTVADVQCTQRFIPTAAQRLQRLMVADIQCTQLILIAVQRLQLRIVAHVQFRQLILPAVQRLQFRVFTHVQFR